MTKKNNANSARRKLIPAVGMLVVSAMMLSSSTYAWFSMSKDVSVNGMKVQATAEGGLVVTNEVGTAWKTVATAKYNTAAILLPTSATNDLDAWYYNTSDDVNDAKAGQATATYRTLSLTDAAADADKDGAWGDAAGDYYLLNDFYIKSSNRAITTSNDNKLAIKQVKVTGNTNSLDLDKALRVAIVCGTDKFIYAPFDGATLSYTVDGTTATTATSLASLTNGVFETPVALNSVATILDNSATISTTGITNVKVYMYFEGEDANCKSANLVANLDTLSVAIKFGLTGGSNSMVDGELDEGNNSQSQTPVTPDPEP